MINCKIILLAILFFLLVLIILFLYSPRPISFIIKKAFEGGLAVKPANYDIFKKDVLIDEDLNYSKKYKNSYLDIIRPKFNKEKNPIIFWIHGGAYVGGDKLDVREYGVQIAREGYIVVNVNYDLAPHSTYPKVLYQIGEAYRYILSIYNDINGQINKIYFAGDSAGAQIASQFINIQVNEDYAKSIKIEPLIGKEDIEGAILFCGVYDLKDLEDKANSNLIFKYLYNKISWAYFGSRSWRKRKEFAYVSIIDYVDDNFPSTFISDGNTYSFPEQAMDFSRKLRENNVYVKEVFFENLDKEIMHEYQFQMDLPESQETLDKLINFLKF